MNGCYINKLKKGWNHGIFKTKELFILQFNKKPKIAYAKINQPNQTNQKNQLFKKLKPENMLGSNIIFADAVSGKADFKNSVPSIIYKDYVCYTIAELRSFIDAAEIELQGYNGENNNHAIAFFPLIEASRISVGITSCLLVHKDPNGEFKNQFNKQLPNGANDPSNPFNGNGTDLDAYNHGQGYP